MKTTHPFVSSSPAPHFIEEGQPKNAGWDPALIFVCPSPTRVGAAEDEVMAMMIYWGNGTAPASWTLFLVGTDITSFGFLKIFRLETFFHFILTKTSFLMMSSLKNLINHLVFFRVLLSISSKNTVAQIPLAQIPLAQIQPPPV